MCKNDEIRNCPLLNDAISRISSFYNGEFNDNTSHESAKSTLHLSHVCSQGQYSPFCDIYSNASRKLPIFREYKC